MESAYLPADANSSAQGAGSGAEPRGYARVAKRLVIPSASGVTVPVAKKLSAPEVKRMLSRKAMEAASEAMRRAAQS
jgi:hypothetical protein